MNYEKPEFYFKIVEPRKLDALVPVSEMARYAAEYGRQTGLRLLEADARQADMLMARR